MKAKAKNRKKTGEIRSFACAEISKILSPWTFDGGYSNEEISAALKTIRGRSRDMQKNSEQYKRWLDLFVANVVGADGFTLTPLPFSEDDFFTIDRDAAKMLKYHFWRWATNPKMADSTGRKTFRAICALVAENWARDGEGIVMIDRHAQNKYGIALRVVRPDALDETIMGEGNKGEIVRNGVAVNATTLKPIAYYFRANNEDRWARTVANSKKPVRRIPATDVLHVFTQHDECQTRGIPLGCSVLRKLKMLDEYNYSEIVAAREEANTTGFFSAPAGREDEICALNEDSAASAFLCRESSPGTKFVLPQGWSYDIKTPTHPNRELVAFKNSMLRDIASGLGVEYANFANDWAGVSYSSVRVGTLAERDNWRILQAQFVEQFVTPVYLAWLESFLSLAVSGKLKATDYERLSEHEFRGRRWEWVDPMKDVNASVIAVANGWKTDEQIAAEYGTDIDDNIESIRRTNEAKTQAGIAPNAPRTVSEDSDSENEN